MTAEVRLLRLTQIKKYSFICVGARLASRLPRSILADEAAPYTKQSEAARKSMSKPSKLPDISLVSSTISYDPFTGLFTWKTHRCNKIKIGDAAGTKHRDGYCYIVINKKRFPSHRLAWFLHYGHEPVNFIDHINGKRTDNRIINLREATQKQNAENRLLHKNNSTGFRNVHFNKRARKFQVALEHNGDSVYCGIFDKVEDADKTARFVRSKLFTHANEKGNQKLVG